MKELPNRITVEKNVAAGAIRIMQDDDLILVSIPHIPKLVDALVPYLADDVFEDAERDRLAEGYRVWGMAAKVDIQQLRRDISHQEGRLAVIARLLGV